MSVYIINSLTNGLYSDQENTMFTKGNLISQIVTDHITEQPDGNRYNELISNTINGTGIRVLLIDNASIVKYDSNSSSTLLGKSFSNDCVTHALNNSEHSIVEKISKNQKNLSISVPIHMSDTVVGAVYLAKSLEKTDKIISSIRIGLVAFIIVICILVSVLSIGVSFFISSPLTKFTVVAKEISKGNFDKRIPVNGHSEADQMADALNYMCAELEHLENKRKKFVSDASHELKTPMATIKLLCDSIVSTENPDMSMVKEFLNDLSEEIDRLTRIIEKLLLLTKLDTKEILMTFELVDVGLMVEKICNKLEPIAFEKNISIVVNNADNLEPVMLDYDKIWEAVYNVVDNAIKYSKIDGAVTVKTLTDGENVIIKIYDNGKGIPDEFKERIFERFYRLDDSRARETGGTGLGLSITREAIILHGGKIHVEDNEKGGSCFIISIPIKRENKTKLLNN